MNQRAVASFASRRGYNNIWNKSSGMTMTQQRNAEYKDRAGLHGESRHAGRVKKGGAGHGKGNWGAAGSEYEPGRDYSRCTDKNDPNYDSEDERLEGLRFEEIGGNRGDFTRAQPSLLLSPGRNDYAAGSPARYPVPAVTLQAFRTAIMAALREYFVGEDGFEVMRVVDELQSPTLHYELVRRAVTLAMDRTERQRELVSVLLAQLHGAGVLTTGQIGKGFERLFELADDLELDDLLAKQKISHFLARAVADEILPPSFLTDPLVEGMGGGIVASTKVILSKQHGLVRLSKVWGPGDGRPVAELKEEVKLLLQEYLLSSRDLAEAAKCVHALRAPHYHHEVVKRAVVLALDSSKANRAMMSSLLAYLFAREIVSPAQMQQGFQRLAEAADDLALDTPNAKALLREFALQAVADGGLPAAFAEQNFPEA